MELQIQKASESDIASMRAQFLNEVNVQFIHNKCHDYGWADVYLLKQSELVVGYAAVWGLNDRDDRDTLFEFYLLTEFRYLIDIAFERLQSIAGFKYLECQTNIPLQHELMLRYGINIHPESILFKDSRQTTLSKKDITFRKRTESDLTNRDDDGPFLLIHDNKVVAHGGLMYNYNKPYADIYMHVIDQYRNQGFGALIVQELKSLAYSENKIPAARCHITNKASRKTLEKAGFEICGYLLVADVRK